MRQAVMTKPGKIEFRDVQEPSSGPREVLLRLKNIGVCGSDIHVWHGKHPFTKYPVVQGHEYSAVIEAVGEKVETAKPGMRAAARPQLICGECGPCRRGDYHVCQNLRVQGFQAPGCAQDLFVVPEERLVLFPESMSYEQGAMIEPASVGAHSTGIADGFQGKNVVVSGAGTIGNIVAQFVQAKGAPKVLITDISDFRLEIAKTCGIQYTANVTTEPFEDAVKRVFGDDGFQVGFEAAGVQDSIESLIRNIEKGGEVIVLGVYEKDPRINMGFVVEHEIKLTGSMMYRHEDYLEAVEFISKGRIAIDPLITKHFPFRDYNEAYKFIDDQGDKTLKVMIDM
ncbi:MAG: alcohol dehydrogenase catalytic domain-containing protein [bacterium]|nr:alcohol dehydrogenase catalytic domain-containing protein [bacterium]